MDERKAYIHCMNPSCDTGFFQYNTEQKFCSARCRQDYTKKISRQKTQLKKLKKNPRYETIDEQQLKKIKNEAKLNIAFCLEQIVAYRHKLGQLQELYHKAETALRFQQVMGLKV